ncbi:hypothetical protein [Mycoplasmopsis alligatoris]|uniref:Conserved domain protein n=1 Tax=Mycoplasmopsis alligatoris A21JP2 TaxID=747682 RepID=D4XV54_9BACT|nr:hypothetical protein [Mycoplasmopsis alligatoris]EFF41781.1 conserved domain protein [Mycoplasmopsis alligatoris A21JP2]
MEKKNVVDINENFIKHLSIDVLDILLKDQTTNKNIIWATNNYISKGDEFSFDAQIKAELITGHNYRVIKPRCLKAKEEQNARIKKMAEVFTPSWVCNAQNNLVDNEWMGYENSFNIPSKDNKTWVATEKVEFKNRTWQEYVEDTRMEITCGEAPYLVSRYDTVTGDYIDLKNRIGILDRKMRIINENVNEHDLWLE